MDRFEQRTAYFHAVSDFHRNRHIPLNGVLALSTTLPDLLGSITQPKLKIKLRSMMAANSGLLCKTA